MQTDSYCSQHGIANIGATNVDSAFANQLSNISLTKLQNAIAPTSAIPEPLAVISNDHPFYYNHFDIYPFDIELFVTQP